MKTKTLILPQMALVVLAGIFWSMPANAGFVDDLKQVNAVFKPIPPIDKDNLGDVFAYSNSSTDKEIQIPLEGGQPITRKFSALVYIGYFASYETVEFLVKRFEDRLVQRKDDAEYLRTQRAFFYNGLLKGLVAKGRWRDIGKLATFKSVAVQVGRHLFFNLLLQDLSVLDRFLNNSDDAALDPPRGKSIHALQPQMARLLNNKEMAAVVLKDMIVDYLKREDDAGKEEAKDRLKTFLAFSSGDNLPDLRAGWYTRSTVVNGFDGKTEFHRLATAKEFMPFESQIMSLYDTLHSEMYGNKPPRTRPVEAVPQNMVEDRVAFVVSNEGPLKKFFLVPRTPAAPPEGFAVPSEPKRSKVATVESPKSGVCSATGFARFILDPEKFDDAFVMEMFSQCKECRINQKDVPPALLMVESKRMPLLKKFITTQQQTCGLDNLCEGKSVREVIFDRLMAKKQMDEISELLAEPCFTGSDQVKSQLLGNILAAFLRKGIDLPFFTQMLERPGVFSCPLPLVKLEGGENLLRSLIDLLVKNKDATTLRTLTTLNWFNSPPLAARYQEKYREAVKLGSKEEIRFWAQSKLVNVDEEF